MKPYIIQLKEWILSVSPDIIDFNNTYDLIENGILDSLQFLELAYQIEMLSGKELDMQNISITDFSTLQRIEEKFFK